jgi:hypothetical protein
VYARKQIRREGYGTGYDPAAAKTSAYPDRSIKQQLVKKKENHNHSHMSGNIKTRNGKHRMGHKIVDRSSSPFVRDNCSYIRFAA